LKLCMLMLRAAQNSAMPCPLAVHSSISALCSSFLRRFMSTSSTTERILFSLRSRWGDGSGYGEDLGGGG